MQPAEEQRVDDAGDAHRDEESETRRCRTRAKKPCAAGGAIAREPIEHAAQEKQRQEQMSRRRRARAAAAGNAASAIAAEVLDHRREADDRRRRTSGRARRLRQEFVPPVEVHAAWPRSPPRGSRRDGRQSVSREDERQRQREQQASTHHRPATQHAARARTRRHAVERMRPCATVIRRTTRSAADPAARPST